MTKITVNDSTNSSSPIALFLDNRGVLILDGGLATELESRGHNLRDSLWSARLLIDCPEAIKEVHKEYLEAGADCIISASYQGTIPGFMEQGLSEQQAIDLLRSSVNLAIQARNDFWSRAVGQTDRIRPIVAASIGPYGASLTDGSEYTGDYGLDEEELVEFHRQRWQILNATESDLFACETIPSKTEASALLRLLLETPERFAWFSFSCRDGRHISDGTPLAEVIAPLSRIKQVLAVGINCTHPEYIQRLIAEIKSVSGKPIVVYPNSGESYDKVTKKWRLKPGIVNLSASVTEWYKGGARLIGGCCRVNPDQIRALREALDLA